MQSRDRDVDSVGACVGMKGMRVQSIIRELRGEKIDIIEFSEDPVVFATHALSPAKVSRISILDPVEKHMEVIVDDSQLSLAIGKKGQNVRLAAKLLGWKIDIKSEEEKRQEVESAMAALVAPGAPVSVLIDYGLAEPIVERLVESGVGTIEKLGSMTPEQIEEIQGIEPQMVERIQESVNAYYGQFEEGQGGGAAEAAVEAEPAESAPAEAESAPAEAEAAPAEAEAAAGEPVVEPVEAAPAEPEAAEAQAENSPEGEEVSAEAESVLAEQFGNMEGAGSPTDNQSEEGLAGGPEGASEDTAEGGVPSGPAGWPQPLGVCV